MNGSAMSAAGNAITPSNTGSRRKCSLKFCANQLERRIVHSAPESRTACSAGFRIGLATPGQQHQPAPAAGHSHLRECAPTRSAAPE
jgi:hypothetical protein